MWLSKFHRSLSLSYALSSLIPNLSPLYSLHIVFFIPLIWLKITEKTIQTRHISRGTRILKLKKMSKSRDTEIKLFGRTITSLVAVNHYDPSPLSTAHGGSDQSKEASSSSSSSCSPFIRPDRVRHASSCPSPLFCFVLNNL